MGQRGTRRAATRRVGRWRWWTHRRRAAPALPGHARAHQARARRAATSGRAPSCVTPVRHALRSARPAPVRSTARRGRRAPPRAQTGPACSRAKPTVDAALRARVATLPVACSSARRGAAATSAAWKARACSTASPAQRARPWVSTPVRVTRSSVSPAPPATTRASLPRPARSIVPTARIARTTENPPEMQARRSHEWRLRIATRLPAFFLLLAACGARTEILGG
jgi:hypothetical protein